jgi:3-isopropylmalate/(R)-2-methylmalate dehydratase small subunit
MSTGEIYPCESTAPIRQEFSNGDQATVDLDKLTLTNETTGNVFSFKPLGDVKPVVDSGGLFNYARKSGMIQGKNQ